MTEWWITTQDNGGERVLGPFESRNLALSVRSYVEQVPTRHRHTKLARLYDTFAVVEVPK